MPLFDSMPAYTCAACGLGVIVLKGEDPIRACACQRDDGRPAAILASVAGHADGRAQANG